MTVCIYDVRGIRVFLGFARFLTLIVYRGRDMNTWVKFNHMVMAERIGLPMRAHLHSLHFTERKCKVEWGFVRIHLSFGVQVEASFAGSFFIFIQ